MTDGLAERIAAARRVGGDLIPIPGAMTLEQGYRVQAALAPMLGEQLGWKIGATNAAGQAALGVGEPIFGRVFAGGVHRAHAEPLAFPGARAVEAEPEIVIEVGEGGTPRAAWFGVEIVRPSLTDAQTRGAGFIVADNAAHVALVLGPAIPLADLADPAALAVRLNVAGASAGGGSADAVLGDPRRALAWLAGALRRDPRGLCAGDLIATGAMARSVVCPPGTRLAVDCGRWGAFAVAFG